MRALPSHHPLDATKYAPPHGCRLCGHLERDHGTHTFRGHSEPACGAKEAINNKPGKCGCVEFQK